MAKTKQALAQLTSIEPRIQMVRGERVILDADLARIYGVETRTLNQAVRRNLEKFPPDFLIQLTTVEVEELNRSQIVIGSQRHRDPRFRPFAFTEHGAIMAASVLNSPRAVAMSVYVVRAFVKMREDLAANATILKRLAEIDKALLLHDGALRDIYQKLRPLLEPPPIPPKPEIGFHMKEDAILYRTKMKSAPSR